ncbi:hypothetical protein [Brachybacterium saurashtrense]|uniref:Rv3660c-like CheY-like N-terminal domain-containing protein n=1 Tax=Brachybacterium saurashtrense TaxID=556288 RepID=A0A345YQ26_9MICO|nr:hypothetical protein [Brachybacterium saurashtrense]AXK46028.1 hypothetical protein DWV08_10680 [Brachybacterium saurashtrense]RRR23767.1 hypothetical protein DXU92_02430 [Brachybacterium saurashtrense]
MNSTLSPAPTAAAPVPGLAGATVPTDPGADGPSLPRRRRARFPGASVEEPTASARPAMRWAGADGTLAELVRDHATAAGLELVGRGDGPRAADGADAAVCTLIDPTALAEAAARVGAGALAGPGPLLVVTTGQETPPRVWKEALAAGAEAVLSLPEESEDLLSRLAEHARPRTASLLLGVVGGCGGAGASSFAARLAAAARRHGPVTLVDADPLGGGADLLVEAPPREGLRWQDVQELGPDDGDALREGLPVVDEVRMLVAGDGPGPGPDALRPVLSALAPLGGTVVVDLGPEAVPAAAEHLHRLLAVVPATDHAVRAAARRLRSWRLPHGLAQVVVRRGGPLAPVEVCEDLALPLAAAFRDSPRGTVPLLDVRRRGADRAARALLARLPEEVRP